MLSGRDAQGYHGMSLITFPVRSAVPAGATITGGELRLHVVSTNSHSISPLYGVFRILQTWDASRVTWASRPSYDAIPLHTFPQPSLGALSLDITRVVADWSLGLGAQLGVLIGAHSELSPNTIFHVASVNATHSDTWPRLKVTYAMPALSVATIYPQFVDDQHTLTIPSLGSAKHDKNVSLMNPVTVWATNYGPDAAQIQLFNSPNGENFVAEGPVYTLVTNETVGMVAAVFSKYLRVMATAVGPSGAIVNLHYQGQIG